MHRAEINSRGRLLYVALGFLALDVPPAARPSGLRVLHAWLDEINPILRGWVQYFRIGNAARCFAYVRNWVEKKVRRHLMRAKNRPGFGWTRRSTVGLHEALGLFHDYRVGYGARI